MPRPVHYTPSGRSTFWYECPSGMKAHDASVAARAKVPDVLDSHRTPQERKTLRDNPMPKTTTDVGNVTCEDCLKMLRSLVARRISETPWEG